jgi:diacylglycerol kinase family enzyme
MNQQQLVDAFAKKRANHKWLKDHGLTGVIPMSGDTTAHAVVSALPRTDQFEIRIGGLTGSQVVDLLKNFEVKP